MSCNMLHTKVGSSEVTYTNFSYHRVTNLEYYGKKYTSFHLI